MLVTDSSHIFSIITLNCWGIPYISHHRNERIDAIAKFLRSKTYDAVCLQEIWSIRDYMHIKQEVAPVLPYAYYFYSGVFGSGLCIFSKWKIVDAFFHQWSLNGYIHKLHHGDWFGGKGIGLCKINWNDKIVNVYCTHFHAEYDEDNDIYLAHRLTQAYAAASFVTLTASEADLSILAGDLNSTPEDISYRVVQEMTHVLDPYDLDCQHSDPLVKRCAGTSETADNSYTPVKQAQKLPEGKRIDHILFNVKPGWDAQVMYYGNPLPDRIPNQKFSYSDHSAVALQLNLTVNSHKPVKTTQKLDHTTPTAVSQAYKICDKAISSLNKSRKVDNFLAGFIIMFLIGTAGYWPDYFIFSLLKIMFTGLGLYFMILGTLWYRMEVNCLKLCSDALRLREDCCKDKLSEFDDNTYYNSSM